jgi:hypothetical protein
MTCSDRIKGLNDFKVKEDGKTYSIKSGLVPEEYNGLHRFKRIDSKHLLGPSFRFRGRELFERDASCDIYSGVERRLIGPGSKPGI